VKLKVGTFNLNNLFSRWNFTASIDAKEPAAEGTVSYHFSDTGSYKLRTYRGQLVKGKDAADTDTIAARIKNMDLDVLAVQEVEDVDTLKKFNAENLGGMYPSVVLVEGNDERLIDVGILSKLPIGAVTSWQKAVHASDPGNLVFSRDLLQVEILSADRSSLLLTLFNTHLKSQFVSYDEDPDTGKAASDARRKLQAEKIRDTIRARMQPGSRFAIVGDMNDAPSSDCLQPFIADAGLGLTNGLVSPTETRPPKHDDPMPASTAWTHRFKESGKPARYELFDQMWLSQALAPRQSGAWIDRRTKHIGDGSDHDPAWIELNL
jgi:endonuclease/exonuclease/phosphatase family metal-dependent hydrolase